MTGIYGADQGCGCEADTGDSTYACDCEMQGVCICSDDCTCGCSICKAAVAALSDNPELLPYPYDVRTGTSFLGPASPATPADEYEMCPQCYNSSTPKRGIDGINSCPECGCKTDADGLEIVLCPICGKSVKIHSSEEAVECNQKWDDDKKENDEARKSSTLSTKYGKGSNAETESYKPKPLWTSRWLAFRRFINHVSGLGYFDGLEELVVVERKNPTEWEEKEAVHAYLNGNGISLRAERNPSVLPDTYQWFVHMISDTDVDMKKEHVITKIPVNETYFESMREKTFVHFKIEVDMSYKKTGKKIITTDTAEYNKSLHRHTAKGKVKRTVKEDLDTGYALTVTFQHHQPELSKTLIKLLEHGFTIPDESNIKFDRVNEELVNEWSEAKYHTVNAFLKNEHPHEEEAATIIMVLGLTFRSPIFGYEPVHTDHSLDHYKKKWWKEHGREWVGKFMSGETKEME